MRLRRVSIENVKSFLDRTEFNSEGDISILIGPNGGGKTNLLDAIVVLVRRYIFASGWAVKRPAGEWIERYEIAANDALNSMTLQRHSAGGTRQQLVEVEIEVTSRDIDNMRSMKNDAVALIEAASHKYINLPFKSAESWEISSLSVGQRFSYRYVDGNFVTGEQRPANDFLEFLRLFEIEGRVRDEYGFSSLSTPMLYLPTNRSAAGFQSSVQLASYNEFELKRQNDATLSQSNSQTVGLAIGRLAQKFRLLLEKDQGIAAKQFRDDANIIELTKLLKELGYEWSLESINPLSNQYDIRLKKQGSSFLVGAASSGERELLTYLFAIFALNVRDAVIVVDEPELHLHPRWQKTLLQLFIRLAKSTGNQFVLATHSPIFVSPESIQYVSRVFSRDQKSNVLRLNSKALPEMKHLLNIVNSQNNERLFFADKVVLVEGLSDRIFFEAVLDKCGRSSSSISIMEVLSVGGKGFFEAYKKLLSACNIEDAIVADLDYVEEIGSEKIKALFKLDAVELKKDVIDNVGSFDGATLVARIDEAMHSGKWGDAQQTWQYIKSRRHQLRDDLTEEEQSALQEFLSAKRDEKIYVLSKGNLEAYLPDGYRSKNLEKLIQFVSSENFWDALAENARNEISDIAGSLLGAEVK